MIYLFIIVKIHLVFIFYYFSLFPYKLQTKHHGFNVALSVLHNSIELPWTGSLNNMLQINGILFH